MPTLPREFSAHAGIIGASFGLLLLCSCATRNAMQSIAPTGKSPAEPAGSVRKVDFGKASDLKELADHARVFADEMYPKVCALLADEGANPPRQFDIVLQPLKSRNTGEAHLEARRIHINSDYLTNHPARLEKFEKVLVHEMAHLAQQYQYRRPFFWSSRLRPQAGWEEGIADYVLYQLLGTNGWDCPQCDTRYPHYTSGYTCTGAFLLYVEATCGSNIVQQLNRRLRRGSYSDAFFIGTTGRSLDDWWAEFQRTPAFKPGAMEMFNLQQALGYVDNRPPRNVAARFNRYVDQHADAFTRQAVNSGRLNGKSLRDLRARMGVYLYFTQPGGTAEQFLTRLRDQGELPGYAKDEKGSLSTFLKFEEMESRTFPATRTLVCGKQGDSSKYHYTVVRSSAESDWKLQKAWRSAADESVLEEYCVP